MDLDELLTIDIEAEILKDLEAEFSKHMDEGMSYHFMMMYWKQSGWTTVKLDKLQDNKHAVDITYWLDEQGFKDKEDYYRDGREFVFQNPKHATMFALRWV